jgi:hypothetical protein
VKNKNEVTIRSSAGEYLTYIAAVGDSDESLEMRYQEENIWLTQKLMAALYDVSVPAINQHLKTIFTDKELDENSVIKKYLITAVDGKHYNTKHYNLQAIIAVGFKINNDRAVRFRKWAGQIVKDYTIQGWTMDKERLKKGHMFTDEYSVASRKAILFLLLHAALLCVGHQKPKNHIQQADLNHFLRN